MKTGDLPGRLKEILLRNKTILLNIVGTFFVKGGGLLVTLMAMPAYMRYFQNQAILGVWFTLLSMISWIFTFDLGIGNGLRNKLAESIAQKRTDDAKEYVTSSYAAIAVFSLVVSLLLWFLLPHINWNVFFNISEDVLPRQVMLQSLRIVCVGIMIQFILRLITSILYALQLSAVVNFLFLLTNLLIYLYARFAPDRGAAQNLITLSLVQILAANIPLAVATVMVFYRHRDFLQLKVSLYRTKKAYETLRVGIVLLWLQVVWMVVSGLQSMLITSFISPEAVVEYQIYFKVFSAIATFSTLALTPIWSAVTKAKAELRYDWIQKLYRVLLAWALVTGLIGLAAIPFLQTIVNFWLGANAIVVKKSHALLMTAYSVLFVMHNVNTSIGNGMSKFKVQSIWMGIAAVLMVPVSYFFTGITKEWTGVVIGFCVVILPFEIIQPICMNRYLKAKSGKIKHD